MDERELNLRLARLSPAKRALLELKLAQNDARNILHTTIPSRAAQEAAPLSFAQQRLWFLNQLEPESAAYNETIALRLQGDLNVDALKSALNTIVERHEVLRTTIAIDDTGAPIQLIGKCRAVDLPLFELQQSSESDVQRVIAEIRTRPFNLSQDLMLRAALLRTADAEHNLVIIKHHIASDGWSSGVFYGELAALYRAYCQGQANPLPPLPIQYADYAVWQRQWLRGEVLERQISFWKEQLSDLPALELPTDRPRPPIQTYRGARKSLALPPSLLDQLNALSQRQNATLFMTLLAGFQILLHRYTGQEDIAVGSPIAGRTRMETEGLIGFFVNTLVLRTDLSGNPTFKEALTRVREGALKAYEHQDLPFEKIVEELNPERDRSRSPLFQVTFAVQDVPRRRVELPGLIATPVEIELTTAKFDLSAAFIGRDGNPKLRIEYNTDLFDGDTVERLLSHFQVLLQGIVSNPEQRMSELPLLTEAEEHQLLMQWNDTRKEYPQNLCVHELFEQQAERTPDAIAVVFEEQQLSYKDLNGRANQLAHYLQMLGVGPDVLVGLCIERSVDMIVGLLGILKAGGAYVPLDSGLPQERLALMLNDSQAEVLITQEKLLLDIDHHRIVCLNRDWREIAHQSASNHPTTIDANNLAYVIYTSGSTGLPKGVMIPHRGLTNYLCWAIEAYEVAQGQGAPVHSSISFDLSVTSLFAPLLVGRKVVILPQNCGMQPLADLLLRESGFSFVKITPAHLPILAQEPSVDKLAECSRTFIVGGEALTYELLRPWAEHASSSRVINEYGPTETVVGSCAYEAASLGSSSGLVPIGRPIANTQVYILDAYLNPVPLGVTGEIYIGGDGVARGYLNQPELTAERFIKNPFSDDPTSRLYKTGDLARYLHDGNIEFLGRKDDQVKIRGFRIELGEIEAVLTQHPSVRETVVLAREDSPGDKRLVAYVVTGDSYAQGNELRGFLQQKLPEYMVPSAFVFLDALPLTPNGKVDRKALPVADQKRPALHNAFAVPTTAIEEILANIWAEMLKVDKVGIHDNFFELGGHSLLAMRVVSRMRNILDVEIPVRLIFENPTVQLLTRAVFEVQGGLRAACLPPIVRSPRDGALPLSFAQQRLWFIDQLEPGRSVYNVPSAWRLGGALDVEALQQSLEEIMRRHEVLRSCFPTVDGEPVQRLSPSAAFPLRIIDLTAAPEREREVEAASRVQEEVRQPFDLARGPLLRAKVLRLASDDHIFLLTMHHIVSDAWSMDVLFRELSLLYNEFLEGHRSPLSELPVQYVDFAVWQRQWLKGDVLDQQVAYWKKQLDRLPVLQLPTDRLRPAIKHYHGAKARVHFDAALTEKLRALAHEENATLFIMLLTAFQILLARYSGQHDIAVGSPIAGRSMPEIEGLIGFFLNTLVLRGNVSDNPTFREFLRRMRGVALEAYAHQDLPFGKLVEELHPRRELNVTPLFQVMFAMQNDRKEEFKLKGIIAEAIPIGGNTAKFDLLLSLRESKRGLLGTLEYDTDLFDGATIERIIDHFETLLNGIVADPGQRVLQLPLLNEAERNDLLARWNDTDREYPRDLCVHQLFEAQAEKAPDRTAVIFSERKIAYGELERRANQLARYLRKHGVGPEFVVGVCFERSLEMIVAVLAVLKAGGAYLPLDPSYPRERLKLMTEQGGARLILTQENLLTRVPSKNAACHLVDRLDHLLLHESPERLGGACSAENAAYVLFTSGSTGVPKGVLMEHRPLVNLLSWQIEQFAGHAAAKTLQFAPLSFDVSFQEIFSTLCAGGTLIVLDEAERREPKCLLRLLNEKGVGRAFLPFVALQQLAEAASEDKTAIKTLEEIMTAGEQLQATRPIVDLFARSPQCRLVNQYGPTETHVVTSFLTDSDTPNWSALPPIGRPISNSKVYILDRFLEPVPIGVTGELYIGGDSLARGYLPSTEVGQERFIKDRFTDKPGARLYRTGDLARYLSDANIEFLGRVDEQIKIRGFRIEPGEIETILCRHPDVCECALAAREDEPGEKRLVAYVVGVAGIEVSTAQLREFLREQLPEYMVPSAFVLLDSLPTTPSGKVDRRALPVPDSNRPDLVNAYVQPQNPSEVLLAKIWSEVLKLEKVGIHDNFFDLGGHSLMATMVMSRIREVFRIEPALRALFETPTIAGLSAHIEALRSAADENPGASQTNPDPTEAIVL